MKTSPVFHWNYTAQDKIVVNQGGTSSGKTYSILQVLCVKLLERKNICTVVGQDIPNLKAGALRDFSDRIIPSWPELKSSIKSYNKTDRICTFKNGSILEFKSFTDAQDAKGGKRGLLFINEAQGIDYDVAFELILRSDNVFIDYNPNASFWVHEKILTRPDAIRFISNYTHNPFISPQTIYEIELMKSEPMLWRVYGLGFTGKISGVIFPNVTIGDVDTWPKTFQKEAYGLDFGFTNDPTVLVKMGLSDGKLYGQTLINSTRLTGQDIADKMATLGIKPHEQIFADAANPMTIEELRRRGFNVRGAAKGDGSIRAGVDVLKRYEIVLHPMAKEWHKEAQRYIWNPKDPKRPIDMFNHHWDAARYYATEKLLQDKTVIY